MEREVFKAVTFCSIVTSVRNRNEMRVLHIVKQKCSLYDISISCSLDAVFQYDVDDDDGFYM